MTRVQLSHAISGARMTADLVKQAWARQVTFPGDTDLAKGSCAAYGEASMRGWTQHGSSRREITLRSPGEEDGRLLCYTARGGWSGAEWTDNLNDIYGVAYGKSRPAVYGWWRVRSGA
jgi:hypothetical protein